MVFRPAWGQWWHVDHLLDVVLEHLMEHWELTRCEDLFPHRLLVPIMDLFLIWNGIVNTVIIKSHIITVLDVITSIMDFMKMAAGSVVVLKNKDRTGEILDRVTTIQDLVVIDKMKKILKRINSVITKKDLDISARACGPGMDQDIMVRGDVTNLMKGYCSSHIAAVVGRTETGSGYLAFVAVEIIINLEVLDVNVAVINPGAKEGVTAAKTLGCQEDVLVPAETDLKEGERENIIPVAPVWKTRRRC